jgi:hypothetical protein
MILSNKGLEPHWVLECLWEQASTK